jgi:hypothetical protein
MSVAGVLGCVVDRSGSVEASWKTGTVEPDQIVNAVNNQTEFRASHPIR